MLLVEKEPNIIINVSGHHHHNHQRLTIKHLVEHHDQCIMIVIYHYNLFSSCLIFQRRSTLHLPFFGQTPHHHHHHHHEEKEAGQEKTKTNQTQLAQPCKVEGSLNCT